MRLNNKLEYIEQDMTKIKDILELPSDSSFDDITNAIFSEVDGNLIIFKSIEERDNSPFTFKNGDMCLVYDADNTYFEGVFIYKGSSWGGIDIGATAGVMDIFAGNRALTNKGVISGGFYSEDYKKETIGVIESLWASIPEE